LQEHGIEPRVTVFDKSAPRYGTFSHDNIIPSQMRHLYLYLGCPRNDTLPRRKIRPCDMRHRV
jgi:Zn/Cd-binding protein ZinT